MEYSEILPDDIFTHHIESYWDLSTLCAYQDSPLELLLPTCTFNIIFTDHPCQIRSKFNTTWVHLTPGAYFFGQRNTCIYIKSKSPLKLFGVRFKPFAFANIINIPIFKLNDAITPLEDLFELNSTRSSLIHQIVSMQSAEFKIQLINDLMYALFQNSLSVDETLRAQLNYIMDRKGLVKISDLFKAFSVSKVTLRKHFINKVGLTPKKVSQIWRMNHLFQLKEECPNENLTSLSLNAGFYDQAHFIKDFKLLFGDPPRKFFTQNTYLMKFEHQNISKRFTNQYDPR